MQSCNMMLCVPIAADRALLQHACSVAYHLILRAAKNMSDLGQTETHPTGTEIFWQDSTCFTPCSEPEEKHIARSCALCSRDLTTPHLFQRCLRALAAPLRLFASLTPSLGRSCALAFLLPLVCSCCQGDQCMPQFSWQEHLQWILSLDTSYTPKPLDPTLEWAVQHARLFRPVAEFRRQVVDEIRDLVTEMHDETTTRLHTLPSHVQRAHTTAKHVTQAPVFTFLLRQINYPQADTTHRELSFGFRLTGQLQPGTNWCVRTDQIYLNPKTQADFAEHNERYTQQKLRKARIDEHHMLMPVEIVQEVKMGRMNGPFTQPPHWQHHTRAQQIPRAPTPTSSSSHARDSARVQHTTKVGSDGDEKIRWGEDWRRSGRNSTCIMRDQPYHRTPDHFASLAIQTYQHDPQQHLQIWGMITTEHTRNSRSTSRNKHTCCCTHQKDSRCGATTCSSSDPQL